MSSFLFFLVCEASGSANRVVGRREERGHRAVFKSLEGGPKTSRPGTAALLHRRLLSTLAIPGEKHRVENPFDPSGSLGSRAIPVAVTTGLAARVFQGSCARVINFRGRTGQKSTRKVPAQQKGEPGTTPQLARRNDASSAFRLNSLSE